MVKRWLQGRVHQDLMGRLVLVVSIFNALVFPAACWAPPVSVNVETLQLLPPHETYLSRAQIETLTSRVISQLEVPKPEDAIEALDLLVDAPAPVIDGVAERLRATGLLWRIHETVSSSKRDQLMNSQAVGYAKLRELIAPDFATALQVSVRRGSAPGLAYLASAVNGFRKLDPATCSALLDVLETPKLDGQVSGEFAAVIEARAQDCQEQRARLRQWIAAPASDAASQTRQTVGRIGLLKIGNARDADLVGGSLASPDPQVRAAAIGYLFQADDPTVFKTHREAVLRLFLREQDSAVWTTVYYLLQQHDKAALQEIYGRLTEREAATWPVAIQTAFLLRAGPDYDATLSGWTVGTAKTCDDLWRSLAILASKGRRGTDVTDELLQVATKHPNNCTLPDYASSGLVSLSAPLAVLLGRLRPLTRLKEIDTLLGLGVPPSAVELQPTVYWTRDLFSTDKAARSVILSDLRVYRAARKAPQQAKQSIATLAGDGTADPVVRSESLLTLSEVDPLKAHAQEYLDALADTNLVVRRTALIILGNALVGPHPESVPLPSLEVVQNLIQQPDLKKDGLELLRRLVPYADAFAAGYATLAPWAEGGGRPCFALARARTITTAVAADLLDTAATAGDAEGARIRACVGVLVEAQQPVAALAHDWNAMPPEPEQVRLALQKLLTLWNDREFTQVASERVRDWIMFIVSAHAEHLPLSASGQSLLGSWIDALRPEHPKEAQDLQAEYRRRALLALVLAVPVGVALHLAVWVLLLWRYPRSRMLQSLVFWNPWMRKILGLGYMDVILLAVPFARRRLFAPFAASFLGDIRGSSENQLDRIDYYPDSSVRHSALSSGDNPGVPQPARIEPIVGALARHRGRVLLLGKSGLGKSSYLRHSLAKRADGGRDVIVYLRADECRNGVEAEIEKRMQELGRDQSLLRSLIYAGRIYVYVDGYNEVDIKTQDIITGFLADYPRGNILVASQIPLRGLTVIETYELQSLDADQIERFLLSRTAVLSKTAPVRDEAFVQSATAFLEDINARPRDDLESKAFEEILSNPMDLTSIALLLSDARVPDVFALEAQQFESVRQDMDKQGTPFRTDAFSAALLQQRTADQENLSAVPFAPEVVGLVKAKLALVRTFADQTGAVASQEVRFRHDRIRDFFTHFAFMEMDTETRTRYAQDTRFAGVYPFLARALKPADAEDLREGLIRLAADIEDHRVSDSFVREYSWRQRFAPQDPDWMLTYDVPAARDADSRYDCLSRQRKVLDIELNQARAQLAEARRLTRILTTSDSARLLDLAHEICLLRNGRDDTYSSRFSYAMHTPAGAAFVLIALGQPEGIRPFHLELLLARVGPMQSRLVLVTNTRVLTDPQIRAPDLDEACFALLNRAGAIHLCSRDLYAAHVDGEQSFGAIWSRIDSLRDVNPMPAAVN